MLKVENLRTFNFNWECALRSLRNPMNAKIELD